MIIPSWFDNYESILNIFNSSYVHFRPLAYLVNIKYDHIFVNGSTIFPLTYDIFQKTYLS